MKLRADTGGRLSAIKSPICQNHFPNGPSGHRVHMDEALLGLGVGKLWVFRLLFLNLKSVVGTLTL